MQNKFKKKFKWSENSRLSGSAEMVGMELEIIRTHNKGKLTPKNIVEVAKNKNHLFHRYFIWDDSTAAHEFRIEQARGLIQAVRVEIIPFDNDKPKEFRAFVSVIERGVRSYQPAEKVLNDVSLKEQLFADALRDAQTFIEKYNNLVDLEPLFSGVKEVRRRLRLKMIEDKIKKRKAS